MGARADEPGEVQASMAARGASVIAWYGVRIFTDHWALTHTIGRLP